jgi:hypothetical protein
MDEKRWLTCNDPVPMLEHVHGQASNRKLRLFAVACCRRLWDLLPDKRTRKAIRVAEHYAEGLVSAVQLRSAQNAVYFAPCAAATRASQGTKLQDGDAEAAQRYAALAVGAASSPLDPWGMRSRQGSPSGRLSFDLLDDLIAARVVGNYRTSEQEEYLAVATILRDLIGNPFRSYAVPRDWLTWKGGIIVNLAQEISEDRSLPDGALDNARLSILADALEEAGCTDLDILGHLRGSALHVRGCFPVDLILDRQ